MLVAVQRVLNEYDWESWRLMAPHDNYTRLYKQPSFKHILPNGGKWKMLIDSDLDEKHSWCRVKRMEGHLVESDEIHWEKTMEDLVKSKAAWPHAPHPFYDATCIGLNSYQ
jgi:hypothetical protein